MTEEKLITDIKEKVKSLWNSIKEAEKANLKVHVDLSTSSERIVPEIVISKTIFLSGQSSVLSPTYEY